MSEHSALINEVREFHQGWGNWCECGYLRPCRAVALADALEAAERERDDALTERADIEIGLTLCQDDLARCGADLAAARKALEIAAANHHLGMGCKSPTGKAKDCANPVCRQNFTALTALASRGQDPAGGHNAGGPDGAGLGGGDA